MTFALLVIGTLAEFIAALYLGRHIARVWGDRPRTLAMVRLAALSEGLAVASLAGLLIGVMNVFSGLLYLAVTWVLIALLYRKSLDLEA